MPKHLVCSTGRKFAMPEHLPSRLLQEAEGPEIKLPYSEQAVRALV
jgi:hypothetical protein